MLRVRVRALAVTLGLAASIAALAAAPREARADRRPTLVTDGFYAGARLEPGIALSMAWDVDVYLRRSRAASVGPAVSVSVLNGLADPGRVQDVLVAVDALRFKLGPSLAGGEWRPFASLGAGFTYARLPAGERTGVEVIPSPGAMPVRGSIQYPALEAFSPLISLGGGVDWFTDGPIALSGQIVGRLNPIGPERLPVAWLEVQLGLRFGL